jgi:hypothetical protein
MGALGISHGSGLASWGSRMSGYWWLVAAAVAGYWNVGSARPELAALRLDLIGDGRVAHLRGARRCRMGWRAIRSSTAVWASIQAFGAHGLPAVTVVADAGMSEANLAALEDAGLRFIVGARIPDVSRREPVAKDASRRADRRRADLRPAVGDGPQDLSAQADDLLPLLSRPDQTDVEGD